MGATRSLSLCLNILKLEEVLPISGEKEGPDCNGWENKIKCKTRAQSQQRQCGGVRYVASASGACQCKRMGFSVPGMKYCPEHWAL